MWDRDIRVGLGTTVVVAVWLAAGGFIAASWQFDMVRLGAIGAFLAALAGALTVIRDNGKTRRAVRTIVRDGLAPVHDFRRDR